MRLDLVCRSDGETLRPLRKADAVKVAALRGRALRWTAEEQRNPRRHRRFFAAVSEAFVQWPEAHAFSPVDTEHLRSWLLTEAGYCDVMELHVSARDAPAAKAALEATMMFANVRHVFVAVGPNGRLQVRRPRSMAFASMTEIVMRPVMNRVFEILRAAGLDPDRLADESGRAA